MAATEEANSTIEIPLLVDNGDHTQESPLNRSLHTLEFFLSVLGYSPATTAVSWLLFFLIGVVAPFLLIGLGSFSAEYEIRTFNLEILFSHAIVASISLFLISHNLRKYGLKKLLFIDRSCSSHLHQLHIQHIHVLLIVQLVGILSCLSTAASISHKAQRPWICCCL